MALVQRYSNSVSCEGQWSLTLLLKCTVKHPVGRGVLWEVLRPFGVGSQLVARFATGGGVDRRGSEIDEQKPLSSRGLAQVRCQVRPGGGVRWRES